MQPLIANLWVVALVGFGVSGLALQRRFASLRLLVAEHHPRLAVELGGAPQGQLKPPAVVAMLRWLLAGEWHGVEDPLLQAYAATCLRLLRLSLAWLVGLLAALILLA